MESIFKSLRKRLELRDNEFKNTTGWGNFDFDDVNFINEENINKMNY